MMKQIEAEALADALIKAAGALVLNASQGNQSRCADARHWVIEAIKGAIIHASPEPSEAEVEAVARPIYDELEGPINNQSFDRQMKQWERAKVVARAAIAALRAAKEKDND